MARPRSEHPSGYVCSDPTCNLGRGVFGPHGYGQLDYIEDFLLHLPPPPVEPATPDGDPAVDCPECAAADPARAGTLLQLPAVGTPARQALMTAQDGATGLFRAVVSVGDGLLRADFFNPDEPTNERYRVGAKVMVGQVLTGLPYDGHVLAHGNQDMFLGKKWDKAVPNYGPSKGAPLASASDEPTYIRELQRDLLLLGYFSKSRGKKTAGKFGSNELGAVLALKQDLRELYGIETTDTPETVTTSTIIAETFSLPIHFQASFVSPARLIRAWAAHLSANTRTNRSLGRYLTQLRNSLKALKKRKTAASFDKQMGVVSGLVTSVLAELDELPFRRVLETPEESYSPFEESPPTKPAAEIRVPRDDSGKELPPAHTTVKSLFKDPVFEAEGFNSRAKNRTGFKNVVIRVRDRCNTAAKRCGETRSELGKVAVPGGGDVAGWTRIHASVVSALETTEQFVATLQFFTGNLSAQIRPWLDHIAKFGAVDQPTAVYIKGMLAGAPIGPTGRPAYRVPLNPDDFGSPNEAATFIREQCIALGPNTAGKRATTMPEILGLQFFANESGMRTSGSLVPFNLNKEEAKTRIIRLGIDMNSSRQGTFDGVNTFAEQWANTRGWGLGQETEGSRPDYHGVRLHRGLPVVEPGQSAIHHPAPFLDKAKQLESVMVNKAIKRFRNRKPGRDCTFGDSGGDYYDCHTCLKRFSGPDLGGTGPDGVGGVFVPRGDRFFGGPPKAGAFFVDLERVTAFARKGGAEEDLSLRDTYRGAFRLEPVVGDEETLTVLRTEGGRSAELGGAVDIKNRVAQVAKEFGTDKAALRAKVEAYMDSRKDLPCSWCHVRIRYAGTGEQAWKALHKMFRIVGGLSKGEDALITKHILEASALRRGEEE